MHLPSSRTVILLVFFALSGCGGKTAEESVAAASKALAGGQYQSAELELKSALQSAPSNVAARLMLAQAYREMGRWEDSEKELKKAREHGATLDDLLAAEAYTLIKLGRFQDVIDIPIPSIGASSQTLATLHAERASAYVALGKPVPAAQAIAAGVRVLANAGGTADAFVPLLLARARLAFIESKHEEALGLLDRIEGIDANAVDALYLKAQLLNLLGKGAEASQLYQRIIEVKPHEVLAHIAIVDAHLRVREFDRAESALRLAEKHNPTSLGVMRARAKLLVLQGDWARANTVLQKLLRVDPEDLPTVLMDASVNFGLGNHERSLKSARRILASVPGHLDSAKLVAANELRMGNHQAAIEVLTPFVRNDGADAKALTLLADAYFQGKQYDQTMQLLQRAAALQPKDAGIMQSKARVYVARGQSDLAVKELESAVRMGEGGVVAHLNLIMVLIAGQEFERALAAIDDLDRKAPKNPVVGNLRGVAYLGLGKRAEARKAFEAALDLQPAFFTAAENLARLDMLENKSDQARARYLGVLKADGKNVQAMLALAAMAKTRNDGKQALDWLEKASAADTNALDAQIALAEFHLEQKAAQRALNVARDAVARHPDHPRALTLLGRIQLAAGDQLGAISTLNKAVEKAPRSADAHVRLAAALVAGGRVKDARAALERALTLDPGHRDAFDALLVLDTEDDPSYEQALARARAYQASNPQSPLGYTREGDALFGKKRYALAAKAYERSLQKQEDIKVFSMMHTALVRAGNAAAAERKLAEALARKPVNPDVALYAAQHYMAVGRDHEAVRLYESVLPVAPNNFVMLNNLAVLYQRQNDGRALEMAERAYRIAPGVPGVMNTLGWILMERGDAQRALPLLRDAVERVPTSATWRYQYAVALAKVGRKEDARTELQRVLSRTGDFPEAEAARSLLRSL